MHVPDGFIDGGTSVAAGVVAAVGIGASIRVAGRKLEEHEVPLAGLTAAFVFAAQMFNFPVASGTSGHLLGGVLAAVLLGPATGAVCVTVVVAVQAVLFADGGLSALGLNVVNMALVTVFAGYAIFVLLRRLLPDTHGAIAAASGVAAGLAVVCASVAFAVEYAIGGSGGASVSAVTTAMVGVHVLIGIGEGVITGLIVSTVLASRPDLVRGAASVARLEPQAAVAP